MKKYLKITLVFCLIFVLTALLCGCDMLDEMRASQAFYKGENTVVFGGAEYKYLTTRDTEMDPFFGETDWLQITEDDVPVLLSDMFGDGATISEDKKFIGTAGAIYCRADCHKEMEERLKLGFIPETYCYNYYNSITDRQSYYILTDQEKDAINNLITSTEATAMPDGATLSPQYQVYLELCSKDLLFRTSAFQLFVTEKSTYYLLDYTESGTLVYTVPENQKSVFQGIMAAAINRYSIAK